MMIVMLLDLQRNCGTAMSEKLSALMVLYAQLERFGMLSTWTLFG